MILSSPTWLVVQQLDRSKLVPPSVESVSLYTQSGLLLNPFMHFVCTHGSQHLSTSLFFLLSDVFLYT
jgi:hypothetical protein